MDPTIKTNLIKQAIAARKNSYSPYSKYRVGAALITSNGKVYTGCNVENVAYGESICAERTAFVKAVSEGHRNFSAIAVATENGASPCGSCRQVMHEFSPDLAVIIVDEKENTKELSLRDLLPHSLGPNLLGK